MFDVEKFFEQVSTEEFDETDALSTSLKCSLEVAAYIRYLESKIEEMERKLAAQHRVQRTG